MHSDEQMRIAIAESKRMEEERQARLQVLHGSLLRNIFHFDDVLGIMVFDFV